MSLRGYCCSVFYCSRRDIPPTPYRRAVPAPAPCRSAADSCSLRRAALPSRRSFKFEFQIFPPAPSPAPCFSACLQRLPLYNATAAWSQLQVLPSSLALLLSLFHFGVPTSFVCCVNCSSSSLASDITTVAGCSCRMSVHLKVLHLLRG